VEICFDVRRVFMRRFLAKVSLLVGLLILSAPTMEVHGYGTSTHTTISFYAYNAALNIQTNFFNALNPANPNPQQAFTIGTETYTALGWVAAGSIREDTDPLPSVLPVERPLFHFYDPQFGRGLFYIPPPAVTGFSGVSSVSGTSSPVWATSAAVPTVGEAGTLGVCWSGLGCPQGPSTPFNFANNYSFSGAPANVGDARSYYLNGLTMVAQSDRNTNLGLMFLSLGHVIHLLQDAAQPQHVRNDAHLESGNPILSYLNNPSVYEHYVDATYSSPRQQNWTTWATSYSPTSFPLLENFFSDGKGRGLAEFTNEGFVSAGTNCTTVAINNCAPLAGYNLPIIDDVTTPFIYTLYRDQSQCVSTLSSGANGQALLAQFPKLCTTDTVTFLGNNVLDDYAAQAFQNEHMSTYSIFDLDLLAASKSPIFSLNHFNYDQQATLLLPRAVGYSAGLLNYFFRGSMTAQGGPSGFTISNNTMNGTTPESMNGSFALYYDDQNGNRNPVQGASWSLSIASGATSSQLTFTAPTNLAPAKSGQYILVFQGTLGAETGAVAGVAFQQGNPSLTVTLLGQGSGRISSIPAGINCGDGQAACTAGFPMGALLTLTATPDSGSTFAGAFCQGEPNLPPSSNPLSLNLSANVTCSFSFGIATSASVLSVSCDQIATNSVQFTAVTQATGSLSGPSGFNALVSVGARPSPFFSNTYLFIGGSVSSLDCGAWSPGLAEGEGTCTRSGSQPAETIWSMTSTQQWDSNVPNPPPLDGLAAVLSGSVVLASENIGTCTIK
jgi:hypothetical protein